MKQMADPKFAKAIDFMSKDPAACKDYYMKHDPEFFQKFIEFFSANMKKISGQMEKLGLQENKEQPITKSKTKDEIKMEEILKRPDVQDAIQNPEIQKILSILREDPSKELVSI